jgi:hypothetical protein
LPLSNDVRACSCITAVAGASVGAKPEVLRRGLQEDGAARRSRSSRSKAFL